MPGSYRSSSSRPNVKNVLDGKQSCQEGRGHGEEIRRAVNIENHKPRKARQNNINKNNLKVIKRSNKLIEALDLPTICNLNPRSVYNKVEEFHTFVQEESVDLLFMSESWEREHLTLDKIIKLEDHTVISNVVQRIGQGGRPAIIANHKKYHVQNLTNTVVQIP